MVGASHHLISQNHIQWSVNRFDVNWIGGKPLVWGRSIFRGWSKPQHPETVVNRTQQVATSVQRKIFDSDGKRLPVNLIRGQRIKKPPTLLCNQVRAPNEHFVNSRLIFAFACFHFFLIQWRGYVSGCVPIVFRDENFVGIRTDYSAKRICHVERVDSVRLHWEWQ